MLLKVGTAMMLVCLVLSAGLAAVGGLRGGHLQTSRIAIDSLAAIEKKAQEEEKQQREYDPGQQLGIYDKAAKEPVLRKLAHEEAASKAPPRPPVVPAPDRGKPTPKEVALANTPRYYQPTSDTDMTLTIEALGLYNVPVISSLSYEVLDRGLMHEPETSLPWDGGDERNVFIGATTWAGRVRRATWSSTTWTTSKAGTRWFWRIVGDRSTGTG
jgi:hypothetical protein